MADLNGATEEGKTKQEVQCQLFTRDFDDAFLVGAI